MLISEEYREQNRKLHESNPEYGISGAKYTDLVRNLCHDFKIKSILDYGCGKEVLKAQLGPELSVTGYDPGIKGIDVTPLPHDLVYCGDVLEHVEPDSLGFVLSDIKRCTRQLAVLVTNSDPAWKKLPDGRNAHLIQKPMYWWAEVISEKFRILSYMSNKHDHVFVVQKKEDGRRRWEWLYELAQQNDWKVGAELGVHTGRTTLFLALRGITMVAVDMWSPRPELRDVQGGQTYEDWDQEKVFKSFVERVNRAKLPVKIYRESTGDAAKHIVDHSLDFVFVDAAHNYQEVKNDIENWLPKVKEGGMICGHDYNWPTVRQAVKEKFDNIILGYDNCWGVWV